MRPAVRRRRKYKRYQSVMQDKPHIIQMSFERSGRVWLASMMKVVANVKSQNLEGFNLSGFEDVKYFHSHFFPYYDFRNPSSACYILLMRDPRDAIRSQFDCLDRLQGMSKRWEDVRNIIHRANVWKQYFDLIVYNTMVVQYERLCLYPVGVIKSILKFGGLETKANIMDVVEGFDQTKGNLVHASGLERYNKHCLKWQKDDRLIPAFNDLIWDAVGDIMVHCGYLKDGHSNNLVRE